MWIFLGIVSFVTVFVFGLWRRLTWAIGWPDDRGHLHTSGDQRYKFREVVQNNIRTYYYAVPCAPGISLRIHRESNWDRLAKKIGLSYEYQFSDPEFDDELYVVSNAPAFQAELAQTRELRDVLRLLFHDRRLQRIECHGQHVVARYREKAEQATPRKPDHTEVQQIVGALYGIAESLEMAKLNSASRWDMYELRAALLASLSTALLAVGIAEFFRIILLERTQIMLDAGDLIAFSTVCAVAMLFALLAATVTLLRGSAYAHVILAEVFISGGLGLLMGGYATVRDINVSFDHSVQRKVQADVLAKQSWRGRKTGTHYELRLRGHDGVRGLPAKLEVSYAVYQLAQEGKPVTLAVRDGALGYRWVEEYYFY